MALAKKLKAARKTKRMTIAEILGGESSTKNKKNPTSPRSSDGEDIDPEDETPVADGDIKVISSPISIPRAKLNSLPIEIKLSVKVSLFPSNLLLFIISNAEKSFLS